MQAGPYLASTTSNGWKQSKNAPRKKQIPRNNFLKRQIKQVSDGRRAILQEGDLQSELGNVSQSGTVRDSQSNSHRQRSSFTVDATKVLNFLLREHPDASDEHVSAWAAEMDIDDEFAQEHVKKIRRQKGFPALSSSHLSPSAYTSSLHAKGLNHRSEHSVSLLGETRQHISQSTGHFDVLTSHDDTFGLLETPAQLLARGSSQNNSSQPGAVSAMDTVQFMTVNRFERYALGPVHDVAPDEHVPRLPSFAEAFGTHDDIEAPSTTGEFILQVPAISRYNGFSSPHSASARQLEMRRTDGPLT